MDTDVTTADTSPNLVDRVKLALSGYQNQNPFYKEKEEKITKKVDGRTKAFRDTVKRIENRRIKKEKKGD